MNQISNIEPLYGAWGNPEVSIIPSMQPQPRVVTSPPFGMDYREWFKYRAGLGLKMNAVRSKIERIAKNGKNLRENYKYAEAADIYDEVRKILFEESLGFNATLLKEWEETRKTRNGEAPITKVLMLINWTDLDTGYFEEMQVVGTGLDYGDKGIYKAYTGAEKYALVITFMIPTGDDPVKGSADPEREFPEFPQGGTTGAAPVESAPANRSGRSSNRSSSRAGRSDTPTKAGEGIPAPGTKEVQKVQEGSETPPEEAEDANEPINEALKNEIKIQVTILAGYSTDTDTKKAQAGVYESLKVKLKLSNSELNNYTMQQGREALKYLNAWIEDRKEKKRKKEEAVKQQIEAREATEELERKKEAQQLTQNIGEESQEVLENE